MYTKDKSNRITLRLNDEQFAFVKANADLLGVSPSEFLRMVCNASMATVKACENNRQTDIEKTSLRLAEELVWEGLGRENDKTSSNDSV